jgi:hypothetical protein
MKSYRSSVKEDAWQKIFHFRRKVTPKESGVGGAITPEGRSVGVHLSRPSAEDRCQQILRFEDIHFREKWCCVGRELPKAEASEFIMTVSRSRMRVRRSDTPRVITPEVCGIGDSGTPEAWSPKVNQSRRCSEDAWRKITWSEDLALE